MITYLLQAKQETPYIEGQQTFILSHTEMVIVMKNGELYNASAIRCWGTRCKLPQEDSYLLAIGGKDETLKIVSLTDTVFEWISSWIHWKRNGCFTIEWAEPSIGSRSWFMGWLSGIGATEDLKYFNELPERK